MATVYEITLDEPPLRIDTTGVLRIAGTRVTLDTLVNLFNSGATPEEIAVDFPSLDLRSIYGAITHYLNHKADLDAYLHGREMDGAEIRRNIEDKQPMEDFRARLLERAVAMGIR